MNSDSLRNPVFDIMKGITILLVIVGHAEGLPFLLKNGITSFHMPLFFILAGYFFRPNPNLKQKLKKDSARMLIPFVAVELILIGYSLAIYFINQNQSALIGTLKTIIFPCGVNQQVSNSVPVWFLVALFWAHTIVNIAFVKLERHKYLCLVVLSLSATFIYEYTHFDLPFAIIQGCSAIPFLLIGYLLKCDKLKSIILPLFALAVYVCNLPFSKLNTMICAYGIYPIDFVGAIGGTFLIYMVSRYISRISGGGYLNWAGINSMVILCAYTIERYINIWRFIPGSNPYVLIVCKIIFCSIVVVLCYQWPFTRAIFKLRRY